MIDTIYVSFIVMLFEIRPAVYKNTLDYMAISCYVHCWGIYFDFLLGDILNRIDVSRSR